MTPPVPELADDAAACAEALLAADSVLVAAHVDADGLTSGAVASEMLARAGVDHEVTFEKQLDAERIAAVAATDHDTALFVDFGSGQLDDVVAHEDRGAFTPVVVDHHQPAGWGGDDRPTTAYHCNPLLVGLDGATELSGAGATYCVARALADAGATDAAPPPADPDNRDLAAPAVVGAVGDMQAGGGALVGANEAVVAEGVAAGALSEGPDLALYGTQTRPLPKLLEYAGDVQIPGVTGDEAGAVSFLRELGVKLRADGDLDAATDDGWRRWVDLTDDERRTVVSGLIRRAVGKGVPSDRVNELVGTTYELTAEAPGTELRDASEFSTLLNATARYDRADVGLAVCLGDREAALAEARRLLAEHRRNLSAGVEYVEEHGVERGEHVQWFHAGDRIRETIVGIVAGMAVGADGVDPGRPIIAFADKPEEDAVKVSARATPRLVRDGVDLSTVMTEAAAAVGGEGGGHDVAAGATVPAGAEEGFVETADAVVGEQLDG